MKEANKKDKKFYCECCEYSTSRRIDFVKHLETNKHKKKKKETHLSTVAKYKATAAGTVCEHCEKVFKFASGLSRHKKTCKADKESLLENYEVKDPHNDIIEALKQKNKEKDELIQKLLETRTTSQESNITNNNITNNTQTNVNINILLNAKCKEAMNLTEFIEGITLSIEDLNTTSKLGYIDGITNIFTKNLAKIEPMNRPIHCSDDKKLEFFIKDEDKWDHDSEKKLDESIDKVTKLQINALTEWKNEHPDWESSEKETTEYMALIKHVMSEQDEKNKKQIKEGIGVHVNVEDVIED